ncbi:hypothetical protein PENTCL1PPCAC_13918, partial [Pristionchus entomophagus]
GGSMPCTAEDYLEPHSHRCLLIIYSDSHVTHTQLDENDCSDALLNYGSIKKIELTEDRRAALVDFECEHAPLLVARCFELHKTNPDVPMPRGATAILPGCSFKNFVYLHFVPPTLSNLAIWNHFHAWNLKRGVILLRPGKDGDRSSRVVVVLSGGVAADRYTLKKMRVCQGTEKGRNYSFYAVPPLELLTNHTNVCDTDGCEECNVADLRENVQFEEEMRRIEATERDSAQKQNASDDDDYDDDYSTRRASSSLFRDISDKSEQQRWGLVEQKQDPVLTVSVMPHFEEPSLPFSEEVHKPLPAQLKTKEEEKDCANQKDKWIPTTINDYLSLRANRCLLIVIGKTPLGERDCRETLGDYGQIKQIEWTSDRRAAFVEFNCHHVPVLIARCYGLHHTKDRVRMPKGVAALLPGCSMENFLHWHVPPSLPTVALREHLTEYCEDREFIIHRTGTDACPSTRVVVEFTDGVADTTLTLGQICTYEVRFNESNHKFCGIPHIKRLSDFSAVSDMRKCSNCNIHKYKSRVKDEEIWKRGEWKAIQEEQIVDHQTSAPLEMEGKVESEEIVAQTKISIGSYITKYANRCLLIVIGKIPLGERDCWDSLGKYGSITDVDLSPDLRVAFIDFDCCHAPLLAARCFGNDQITRQFPLPRGVSSLLPGCSINNFLYLKVPSSLPTVALRAHLDDWLKKCDITVHRAGTLANPSAHAVIEFNDFTATSSFHGGKRILVREVMVNGSSHTFHVVPQIPFLINTSSLSNARGCEKCNVSKMLPIVKAEEQKTKAMRTERQEQIDQWTNFPVERRDEIPGQKRKEWSIVPLASYPSAPKAPANASEARKPPKGILRRKEKSIWASPEKPRPCKSVRFDESTRKSGRRSALTSPDFELPKESIKDNREMEKNEQNREDVPPPDPTQSPTEKPNKRPDGVQATIPSNDAPFSPPPFSPTRSHSPPIPSLFLSLSIDEPQQIEQKVPPPPVLVSEMCVDTRDVIVEESERDVDPTDDVVVEEAVETGEWKEKSESVPMIEPDVNEGSTSTEDTQSSADYESCNESPANSGEEWAAEDHDSDDLLPGKDDKWTHDGAAGDAPSLVMRTDEEKKASDQVGDIVDRMEKASPAPLPTVSLMPEDVKSFREVAASSDEDSIYYDYESDSSTVSTVIGEGDGKYVVDPEEWDEEDQIRHGYKRRTMSTIEEDSQEENAPPSLCSTQESETEEEKKESIDQEEKE